MPEPSDREGAAGINFAVQSNRSRRRGKRPTQLGWQNDHLADHLLQSFALTTSEVLNDPNKCNSFVYNILRHMNVKSSMQ